MKKLMLAVAPVVLALTACATTPGAGSAETTTQQLGMAALKVAVNAKCITELIMFLHGKQQQSL